MTIYKEFTFDAAHRLTCVPDSHPCWNLHGHTYRLRVYISGPIDGRGFCGWSDYSELRDSVKRVLVHLDHRYLNDVDVRLLNNPTTENLALWLWPRLQAELPGLSRIELKESEGTGCIYEGEAVRP
jgi:6-pyruvoyltetrahydropterin/6-carboxytetrahydropterin synthase